MTKNVPMRATSETRGKALKALLTVDQLFECLSFSRVLVVQMILQLVGKKLPGGNVTKSDMGS